MSVQSSREKVRRPRVIVLAGLVVQLVAACQGGTIATIIGGIIATSPQN